MKRYYLEQTKAGVTIHVIEHDKRAEFWLTHPTAKEIPKEAYERFQKLMNS